VLNWLFDGEGERDGDRRKGTEERIPNHVIVPACFFSRFAFPHGFFACMMHWLYFLFHWDKGKCMNEWMDGWMDGY
jgi:hypothetical protein